MSTPAWSGDGTLMSEASYGSFFAFCSIAFRLAFCASILARSSGDTLFAVWIAGDIRPLSVAADLSPYGTARTTPCHRAAILPESVGVVKRHGPADREPRTPRGHEHEILIDRPRRIRHSMRSLDSLPLFRPLELPRAA